MDRPVVSPLVPGRNIVLVGLMGTGKSTAGKALARELARPFVDTDSMVEAEQGKTIAEIFAEDGERAFREAEAEAVRKVSALRGQVIAVGGGAVLDPANVMALKSTGEVVLLDGEPHELAARVSPRGVAKRPLLADADDVVARLTQLRAERHDAYHSAADVVIMTGGRPSEEVAQDVLQWARVRHGVLADEEMAG